MTEGLAQIILGLLAINLVIVLITSLVLVCKMILTSRCNDGKDHDYDNWAPIAHYLQTNYVQYHTCKKCGWIQRA